MGLSWLPVFVGRDASPFRQSSASCGDNRVTALGCNPEDSHPAVKDPGNPSEGVSAKIHHTEDSGRPAPDFPRGLHQMKRSHGPVRRQPKVRSAAILHGCEIQDPIACFFPTLHGSAAKAARPIVENQGIGWSCSLHASCLSRFLPTGDSFGTLPLPTHAEES